jgi:hypothetical protein
VAASLPEDFCIIQRHPEDPLLSLPKLPSHPPEFTPGTRLTQERFDALELNKSGFLWPEEAKLAAYILKVNEKALAWTEAERGHFRDDYFTPVKIPTVAHTPWVHKNILIPTGLPDKVIDMFKEKIVAGVYEPSDAPYQSRWFCVPKKNGSLHVTNLQGPPLAQTKEEKLEDLKQCAQRYARDLGSCDDAQISYLELQEERDNDNLRLAQMLAM